MQGKMPIYKNEAVAQRASAAQFQSTSTYDHIFKMLAGVNCWSAIKVACSVLIMKFCNLCMYVMVL